MMKFLIKQSELSSFKADLIAVGCFEAETQKDKKPKLTSLLKEDGGFLVNKSLKNELAKIIETEEITGAEGKQKIIFTAGLIPARYVVLVGLGKRKDFSLDTLRRVGSAIAKAANSVKARSLALTFQKAPIADIKTAQRIQAAVEGMILGTYKFGYYKKDDKNEKDTLETITFLVSGNPKQYDIAVKTAMTIGEVVNFARDLSNTPGIDMTPHVLAKKAQEIGAKTSIKVEVWNPDKIKTEKMGAFLAIAKGSEEKPVFIHMIYRPAKKAKAKVAVIGKGITFDAGGISLKPPRGMEQMKDDMSGAAVALAVMKAVAVLRPNVQVEAFIPACENMPSGRAIKPGDVVRARNGKTIEIISTDAEGRMILADALSYASDQKPDYMIDLATLTGACAYAVGEKYIAILGNDQRLIDRIRKSGEESGEPFWQLPLEQEYKKGLTKSIADLKNIGSSKADTINAALFLEEFVGDTKWAHLDIASTSWTDEDKPYCPRGSTGAGIRALIYFLMKL